jgi:preprotein translocase subunit SecG
MTPLIITIHVIVSIALILIVLLQTGKGASMGAVFGGAGSQTLFGNTGAASFLGKLTTWAAVIFMITSLTLAYISKSGGKSVVSDIQPTQQTQAPVKEKPPVSVPESPAAPAEKKPLTIKEADPANAGQPVAIPVPVSSKPAAQVPDKPQAEPAAVAPANATAPPAAPEGVEKTAPIEQPTP